MRKTHSLLALAILCITSPSSAAPIYIGNGGAALVCRTEDGSISSAELLDLFEGRTLYRYGEPSGTTQTAVQRVKSFPILQMELKASLFLVQGAADFLPSGVTLEPIQDVYPTAGKSGCKLEQLANFGPDHVLRISSDIYKVLSPVDQNALWIHEAIYRLARQAGATDSRVSRRLTAFLFSNNIEDAAINPESELHFLSFKLIGGPALSGPGEAQYLSTVRSPDFFFSTIGRYMPENPEFVPMVARIAGEERFRILVALDSLSGMGNQGQWNLTWAFERNPQDPKRAWTLKSGARECKLEFETYRSFSVTCFRSDSNLNSHADGIALLNTDKEYRWNLSK